jgi:hypothetical protein
MQLAIDSVERIIIKIGMPRPPCSTPGQLLDVVDGLGVKGGPDLGR